MDASCQTTLDIYSHILKEVEDEAIKALDNVIKTETKETQSNITLINF